MHECHGQPGGVFSGHEEIGGIEPNRGTETCDVVEIMNSYAVRFWHSVLLLASLRA
eukprot:SAG31_NODE_71_length_28115_cov_4.128105_19_plen_56_part_00